MTIQHKISIIVIALTASFAHGQDLPSACAESIETYGVQGYNDSEFIWAVEEGGTIISGDGTDTVKIQWGFKTGTYKLEVLEKTRSGCTNVPSTSTVHVKAPYVDFGYDYQEVCAGDSVLVDPEIEYDDEYRIEWFNGAIDVPNYYAKNTETIWVYVLADDGCFRYDTIEVKRNELPVFELVDSLMACNNGSNYLNVGNIGIDYEWSSTLFDEDYQHAYEKSPVIQIIPSIDLPDTLSLVVTDVNGCKFSDTVIIEPCSISIISDNLSNTFTPNGDNTNEVWEMPEQIKYFPDAVLEIFDRQGRLVYRSENLQDESNWWDGKSKGRDMPMDSYYFVLDLHFMDAQPIVGTVNIIK